MKRLWSLYPSFPRRTFRPGFPRRVAPLGSPKRPAPWRHKRRHVLRPLEGQGVARALPRSSLLASRSACHQLPASHRYAWWLRALSVLRRPCILFACRPRFTAGPLPLAPAMPPSLCGKARPLVTHTLVHQSYEAPAPFGGRIDCTTRSCTPSLERGRNTARA